MRRGLVTGVLGRVIFGAGVLILLFVAYQLWGTDLAESHSQSVLRQSFEAQLHRTGQGRGSTTTTTAVHHHHRPLVDLVDHRTRWRRADRGPDRGRAR